MERDGLWQEFCFPEADIQLRKWVFADYFPVFKIMKKSLQTCYFAFDGFGFILLAQISNIFINGCLRNAVSWGGGRAQSDWSSDCALPISSFHKYSLLFSSLTVQRASLPSGL